MGQAYLRRYPRLHARVAVDYVCGSESSRCVATTIGGGGLFLAQVSGLGPGQEISARFRPARHLPVIQVKACVVYLLAGKGVGIQFTAIRTDDRTRILRLILQRTGDRRLQSRVLMATQIECDKCMTLAFSRDLSVNGMFIETAAPLTEGTSFTVRFNLAYKDKVVTARAVVAYVIEKMGMGATFTEIGPADRGAIQEYVESIPSLLTAESA